MKKTANKRSTRASLKNKHGHSPAILSTNVKILVISILLCGSAAAIAIFSTSNSARTVSIGTDSNFRCDIPSPSVEDIYMCALSRCSFDVTLCSEQCPFGFAADETGCPAECACAEKGIFQGDIKFKEFQVTSMMEEYGYISPDEDFATYVGSAVQKYRLHDQQIVGGKYVIKYDLSSTLKYDQEDMILEAIASIEAFSCIKFEKITSGHVGMHLKFAFGYSCAADVGRIPDEYKKAVIDLYYLCLVDKVKHEIMHALGFYHEQSRPDRDAYIEIDWSRVRTGGEYNLRKQIRRDVQDLNSKYDYSSRMHYNAAAFSTNPNLDVMKSFTGEVLGGREFSAEDKYELNALYKCSKDTSGVELQWAAWSSWSRCDETCGVGKKTRHRYCVSQENKYSQYCKGDAIETSECEIARCPGGRWSQWGAPGPCHETCSSDGQTERTEHRYCLDGRGRCPGYQTGKLSTCYIPICKKNGLWHDWSNWSACRETCGTSVQSRARLCKNDINFAVAACGTSSMKEVEMRKCDLDTCFADQETFGPWSQCSATCEGYRKRMCTGGKCSSSVETEPCGPRKCNEGAIFATSRTSLAIDDVCNAAFTTENWVFGDFSGDGRLDIVCLNAYGVYQLAYGSNSGFKKVWSGSFDRCGGGALLQGDFNFDGKSDLVCKSKRERQLIVRYAGDKRFHEPLVEGWEFCAKYSSQLTTVTRSGRTALMCYDSKQSVELCVLKR